MEPSKENQLVVAAPKKSYQDLLDSQNDLIQNQVERLQQILATQCQLTGVNPLSQEMAAGALSIKIGKKPRDLLNPKAVKYMQLVFSIKDTISKRETREISAQFGVTVTQVRDFFTGQRTRVRKFVRLSKEKVDKSPVCDALPDGPVATSDPSASAEPIPLDTMGPSKFEDGPSSSREPEVLPGVEESGRKFIENIFGLMRKEESFSGQIKLLDWILRIGNPSVLNWFLTEGGVLILATWLSEAATEEQTSVLRAILKVLCHLPLKKASPVHMSAVLQSVNRLRFYRTPDISNRARIQLAEWSKLFQQMMQDSKKTRSASDAQDELLLRQSIEEVMGNESWDDKSEEPLRLLCNNPSYQRTSDALPPLKLLTASGEDTNKKRGVLSSHTREHRKVQMIEQPGQRLASRNNQVAKSTAATQSRPLSADDIQKAKMRAQLQNKGKIISSSGDQAKPEIQNRYTSLQARVSPPASTSCVQFERDEQSKVENTQPKVANLQETLDVEEPPPKKQKRIQIPWHAPREVKIMDEWCVGTGANSKEVEVQKNRIRREREIIYKSVQEIPLNPREPWDREMDYDDSLTPIIPTEQLPDVEPLEETPSVSEMSNKENAATISSTSTNMPEPDLELLAELLKNPELVFALTSGQVGDLSSNETVKLLDLIKTNGADVLVNLAGVKGKADNKVEVSLPSPTPSTETVLNGQKPDYTRNPFSRQHAMANGAIGTVPSIQQRGMVSASTIVQPQILGLPLQPTLTVQQFTPTVAPPVQTAIHEQWQTTSNQLIHHRAPNSSYMQHMPPEILLNSNNVANFNRAPSTIVSATSSSARAEPSFRAEPQARMATVPQTFPPNFPYSEEPTSSNSLRARQSPDSQYYPQNNQYLNNNNNGYAGGYVRAGASSGSNNHVGRPGFVSWSPSNSPSRHEYLPGQNYQEPRVNYSREYRPERAMQANMAQPSAYQDYGGGSGVNKRWRDQRR